MNESDWDAGIPAAKAKTPLKGLTVLPSMVGITPETKKGLKWKSLKWVIKEDKKGAIRKGFLKHPFKHLTRLLKSLIAPSPFTRDGDLFFYGIKNEASFRQYLGKRDSVLILGFSYCHKPFECPSGRFSEGCIHDREHPVCRQCFIGKAMNFLPPKTETVCIPTIHDIGAKVFDVIERYPDHEVIFIITACEMTLTMFGDLGNMAGIRGIGIRLDGRICNTMRAFELSERGIKPGLTVVLDETQKTILSWLRERQHRLQPDSAESLGS